MVFSGRLSAVQAALQGLFQLVEEVQCFNGAVLNQADDEARRAAGEQTLAILKETYDVTGYLTHFEEGERA